MARRVQALMGLKVLMAMASKWQSQAMAHVEMPVEENAGLGSASTLSQLTIRLFSRGRCWRTLSERRRT